MIEPERWERVAELYRAALEREESERRAYLQVACAGDEDLRREVESLLEQESLAEDFLERPAMEIVAGVLAGPESKTARGTDSLIGQTVSRYRIIEKLGGGGMGVVYKAEDSQLQRFVALKFLPEEIARDSQALGRFHGEARAASALNHPNICTVYDIGEHEGRAFIVMEHLDGATLKYRIGGRPMAVGVVLNLAAQIAEGLNAAHSKGIVHRDMKPANIFVTRKNQVKILDFGLAKLFDAAPKVTDDSRPSITGDSHGQEGPSRPIDATSLTHPGAVMGTMAYMSPEQAQGSATDLRTDIFSFGAVVYEMITGHLAFPGNPVISTVPAVLRDQPRPAGEIVKGIPRQLEKIVAQCLQKDPDRRYQHAGDLKIDLLQVEEEVRSDNPAAAKAREPVLNGLRWRLAAGAGLIAISLAGLWWIRGYRAAPRRRKFTQITHDSGLSDQAALSPDGKLVVYAADHGLDSGSDLYVRHVKEVPGGQPIRLTSDGADNTMPDFSPDGSKIVFRSDRGGGGIYEIPAFGGDARLLARDGRDPKYSPDGSQVAYWVGGPGIAPAVPGSGSVWVVPVEGGHPRLLSAGFTDARFPIWSPDGKHLLFLGYTSAKAHGYSSFDWWTVPVNGGNAVETGAREAFARAGLMGPPPDGYAIPACWSASGNIVTFSALSGDTRNLWGISISPRTGKVAGVLEQLTTGGGNEVHASCGPDGTLAFTEMETATDVWLLPVDLDRGVVRGPPRRTVEVPARREFPSLSKDSRFLAVTSNRSGHDNVWIRGLTTGKRSGVSSSSLTQRYPVISPSGTKVAYSVFENGKRSVYVSAPGGTPEMVCEGCLRATDWSRDERQLLVYGGSPYEISLLDLATHRQTVLLRHPTFQVLYGRFSPDNRWVSFTVRTGPNWGYIAIAPIHGPKIIPESAWIAIAPAEAEDWASWSPDGKILYFTSVRDGHRCLWARRLGAHSHRPVGAAFPVQHFHGRIVYSDQGWSVSADEIAFVLDESKGNIWLMSRPTTH